MTDSLSPRHFVLQNRGKFMIEKATDWVIILLQKCKGYYKTGQLFYCKTGQL